MAAPGGERRRRMTGESYRPARFVELFKEQRAENGFIGEFRGITHWLVRPRCVWGLGWVERGV